MLLRVTKNSPLDIDSLPLIYNYPEDLEPTPCWEFVLHLFKQHKTYINKYKNPPYQYFSAISDLTYFVVRVDVLLYLCIVYDGRIVDNENDHRAFIGTMTENLRNCTLSQK